MNPPERLDAMSRRRSTITETSAASCFYQILRFEPKDPPDDSGGWIWDLKDVRRVVYRLGEIAEQRRVDNHRYEQQARG